MSEKRDVTIPTCISISISDDGEHIILKDLNGKQSICSVYQLEKLGKKVFDLANNTSLAPFDVSHIGLTNEGIKNESGNENRGHSFNPADFFSGDDLNSKLLQTGLGFLGNLNTYNRGTGPRKSAPKK